MEQPGPASQYTTQEKLLLAQAIHKLGAVQWPAISKLLVEHPCCSGRPEELFSAEACETAYVALMKDAGMNVPAEDGAKPLAKTHLNLARTFYAARMAELKSNIADCEARFVTLMDEIQRIKAGEVDDAIVAELRVALAKKYGKKVLDTWVPLKEDVKAAAAVEDGEGAAEVAPATAVENENANGQAAVDDASQSKPDLAIEKAKEETKEKEGRDSSEKEDDAVQPPQPLVTDTVPTTAQKSPSRPVSARDKRSTRRDRGASRPAEVAGSGPTATAENAGTVDGKEEVPSPLTAAAPADAPERPSSRNTRRTRSDLATPSTPAAAPVSAGVEFSRRDSRSTRIKDAQAEKDEADADAKAAEELLVAEAIAPVAEETEVEVEGQQNVSSADSRDDGEKQADAEKFDEARKEASEDKHEEDGKKEEEKKEEEQQEEDKKEEEDPVEVVAPPVERPTTRTRRSAKGEPASQANNADTGDVEKEDGDEKAEAKASSNKDEAPISATIKDEGLSAAAEADEKPSRSTRRSGRASDTGPVPSSATEPVTASTTEDAEEPPQSASTATPAKVPKKMGRPRKYPRPEDIIVGTPETPQPGSKTKVAETEDEPETSSAPVVNVEPPPTESSVQTPTTAPKKRGRPSKKDLADAAAARAQAVEDGPSGSRRSARAQSKGDAGAETDDSRLSPVKGSASSGGLFRSKGSVPASAADISASPGSALSDLSDLETPDDADAEAEAEADEVVDKGDAGSKGRRKSGVDAIAVARSRSEARAKARAEKEKPKRKGRPPKSASKGKTRAASAAAETEDEDAQESAVGEKDPETEADEDERPDTATSTRSRASKRKAGKAPSGAPEPKAQRSSHTAGRTRAQVGTETEGSAGEDDETKEEVKEEQKATRSSRKRKTRDDSEKADADQEEKDAAGAETAEEVSEEETSSGDEDEETDEEPTKTRSGKRRSLPSSSLNAASVRSGRRESTRNTGKNDRRARESPVATSPAASTSRRGGSVMSTSHRDRDKAKDEDDEEDARPRKGRPAKKRDTDADPSPEKEKDVRGSRRDRDRGEKKGERAPTPDSDEEKTAPRTSRRTKGLPADEQKEEKEKEKERDAKRPKRNSLRMPSATVSGAHDSDDEDGDEDDAGEAAEADTTMSMSMSASAGGRDRAGYMSSMTPDLDGDNGPGTDAGPSTSARRKGSVANKGKGKGKEKEKEKAKEPRRAQPTAPAPAPPRAAPEPDAEEEFRDTPRPRDNSKEGKMMRTLLLSLLDTVCGHRNGGVFERPVRRSDAPDYFDIIKRPMDLKKVRARIKDGQIADIDEFDRDVLLIFSNAMTYNSEGDQTYNMAKEIMDHSAHHISQFRSMQADLEQKKRQGGA